MNDIKTSALFDCRVPYLSALFSESEYPFSAVGKIKEYILSLISRGLPEFTEISDGVFVGKYVKIHKSAVIEPPAIIGDGCEIRPSAYIRGNLITGKNCVIGNSCELKNCILLDFVQVPHFNYVGDSILGNHAHLGAGVICSNLRTDKKNISLHTDEGNMNTGMRKLGAIIGDGTDIGCGAVLNPGTIIGRGTWVYPLVSVRGTVPCDSIVKSDKITIAKEDRTQCAE